MICPNCQKNLPSGLDVCTGCGVQLVHRLQNSSFKGPQTEKSPQKKGEKKTRVVEAKITKVAKGISRPKPDTSNRIHSEAAITRVVSTAKAEATKVYDPRERPIHGWLVVMEGQQKWEQYTLYEENRRLIAGSGADTDIRFQDEGVEAMHASFRLEDGRVILTDMDTSFGTRVEGEKIIRKEIEDGDRIQVGKVIIKYRKL